MKSEDFSGPLIELMADVMDGFVVVRDGCFLWDILTEESDCVFDGSLFPCMVRTAEPGTSSCCLGGLPIGGKFRAVVVGDGSGDVRFEHVEDCCGYSLGCLIGKLSDEGETRLSFDEDQKGGFGAFGTFHDIGFPMAELGTVVDFQGTELDGGFIPHDCIALIF